MINKDGIKETLESIEALALEPGAIRAEIDDAKWFIGMLGSRLGLPHAPTVSLDEDTCQICLSWEGLDLCAVFEADVVSVLHGDNGHMFMQQGEALGRVAAILKAEASA